MRKLFLIFSLCVLSVPAFCQLGVNLELSQKSYLRYENIFAQITLRNFSGKALIFGEGDTSNGKVEFAIEAPNGIPADKKKTDYNPMIGFVIPPGVSQTILVPVNRLYIVDKAGSYRIKAIINHNQLQHSYESGTAVFTIFNGIMIWEKQIGVPKLYHKEGELEPLSRTARILSFYDEYNKYFALMIEDKDKVFAVQRLGHDIGNEKPQTETDSLNRIHILLQISPKVYTYFLFDINGAIEEKEVYSKTDIPPVMVLDNSDGSVMIVGGRKAIKDIDYTEENGFPVMKEDNL
jgi:hypothetical protein